MNIIVEDGASLKVKRLAQAYASLIEEIEAVSYYKQRLNAADSDEVASIYEHNMKEEMTHVSMLLEYIRRDDDDFNNALKAHLFTEGKISCSDE